MAGIEDVVKAEGPMIARIAATYERRPDIAEELVQDTLLAVWRALPGFEGRSSRRTFVARIAHNVCISHVRRARRSSVVELEEGLVDGSAGPDEAADVVLRRERLYRAVRTLPIRSRQVLSLHLEGFSNLEIAETLGDTPNAIGARLSRARSELSEKLRVPA